MKRILIPAGGAILATGLLAAGLAGTASAANDVDTDPMAKSAATAKAIAAFWADNNGAALKAAKESNVWDGKDVEKLKQKGGYSADSRPGTTPPIGAEKKTTAKVQNVNLPKTIGKVFFVNGKGEKKWCSATSIQSQYRNLVATAGHCVYDVKDNQDVMSKWVFVPGYYQGKSPWGIYVGKQAFTHYDFSTYEDYDRDYAFVTVYNGVHLGGGTKKEVAKSEFDAYQGEKFAAKKEITAAEYDAGVSKYGENGPYKKESVTSAPETVGKPADVKTAADVKPYLTATGKNGIKLTGVEVTEHDYTKAPAGLDNNAKFVGPTNSSKAAITQETYKKLQAEKADGKFLGKLWADKDKNGNETAWYKQQFFIKKWVKSSVKEIYWHETYFVVSGSIKDAGRLGDNVGGQGFAWNQPTGKDVRVFGYPAAPHPDGNKNYTGITPKWCYGKTSSKLAASAAKKIEEHIALKCAMTEGADGGPWLLKYSNAKRIGYVNGVTSTFADQNGNDRVDTITSPYFDGETASVYQAAAKVWSGKAF
ncbi:trypsin-like serine peptidase [Nonomuraea sp. NPDC050790]|uniref:trypsin-like serine peptidase n=1 Tax=Nonomuraea sp. NPDC050790 TaxID=3364371 RepID=UPI0037A4F0A5